MDYLHRCGSNVIGPGFEILGVVAKVFAVVFWHMLRLHDWFSPSFLQSNMQRNPCLFVEDLDHVPGQAYIDCFANQVERHRVFVAAICYQIICSDLGMQP